MSARAANCVHCGAEVAPGARFCAQCGRRVQGDPTLQEPVPVDAAAPRPEFDPGEPHLFGVTPTVAAVVVGAAAIAVGILLLALDAVVAGAVVIVAGAVLLLLLAAGAPQLRRGRSAFGARAAQGAAVVRARSHARRRSAVLRRERDELAARRTDLLRSLGAAVYRADEGETESLRVEVARLDTEIAAREAEMTAVAARTREHVQEAGLQARPTEMVELPDPPEPSPEYPPPGEGTPPEPAVVPEPYPPPDEGTPPEPARIPEPEPPTERA